MLESILSKTSLPNLHPALVHFPIVLISSALIIDLFALIIPQKDWIRKTAALLFVLGAISAGVTYWSGKQAADSVDISSAAQSVLSQHENFALYTLWFISVYATVRIFAQVFSQFRRSVHFLLFGFAIAAEALVLITADYGGALVYKHAVAVATSKPSDEVTTTNTQPLPPSPLPAESGRIVKDQNISWTFGKDSAEQFLAFMDVFRGPFDPQKQVKIETRGYRTFLLLSQSQNQRTILALKPTYKDVQVESEVDLSGFQGTFMLVHHLSSESFDFFRVDGKVAQLGRSEGDMEVIFEDKPFGKLNGLSRLKAVSTGGHFRAYINGKLIVHGHADDASPGKAGILFEGTGILRLAGISVSTLSETHEQTDHK